MHVMCIFFAKRAHVKLQITTVVDHCRVTIRALPTDYCTACSKLVGIYIVTPHTSGTNGPVTAGYRMASYIHVAPRTLAACGFAFPV